MITLHNILSFPGKYVIYLDKIQEFLTILRYNARDSYKE